MDMPTMHTLTSLGLEMNDMTRRKDKLTLTGTIKNHSMITADRTFSATNDRLVNIDKMII